MLLSACDDTSMDYPVTFQEVLREVLERRVRESGREEVARRLGFSMQALDYLRRGYRGPPTKRVPNYISFEHLETLAKAEGISLDEILKEVYITCSALETIRRAELERNRAINEAMPALPSDDSEPG